jgi:hypothetical protein
MAEERLSMKKLRELLRLKWECNLSNRIIGRAIHISPSTVSYYTRAFKTSGLNWPLEPGVSNSCKLIPYNN